MKAAIVSLALAVALAVGGLASCLSTGDLPAVDAGPYGFDVTVDSRVEIDARSEPDSTPPADSTVPNDGARADSAAASDAPAEVDSATSDGSAETDADDGSTPAESGTDAADAAPILFCEGTCSSAGCGTCPDAATVGTFDSFQDNTFNLDAYEVTNGTYAAFLAVNVDPATQPGFCAWNASFVPSAGWPATGKPTDPVANVDWCDAYAFCTWAGRRLCGNIGGGPNSSVYADNGDQSQWFLGCTAARGGSGESGYIEYPYGNTYDASACNGADYGAGAVIPIGSATGCGGGLPGLFDMSGNVREWEDTCGDFDDADAGPEAGATSTCGERGGSFGDDAGGLGCAVSVYAARTTTAPSVGFRCCSQ